MQLTLASGKVIDQVSEHEIRTLIEGEDFAILDATPDSYIQCAVRDEDGAYNLEYQDGSLNDHYEATHLTDGPITLDHVISAFVLYLNDDPAWRLDFLWTRMDLSKLQAPPPATHVLVKTRLPFNSSRNIKPLGAPPPGPMDGPRKYAFRFLLFTAISDGRRLVDATLEGFALWRPMTWRNAIRQLRRIAALLDWVRELSLYSLCDFEDFPEEEFWNEFERFQRRYPGLGLGAYRAVFDHTLMVAQEEENP